MRAIQQSWRDFAAFSGRTGREDFITLTVFTIFALIVVVIGFRFVGDRFWLAYSLQWAGLFFILLPYMAALARRFRDVGRPPWLCLLVLAPPFGWFVIAGLAFRPGVLSQCAVAQNSSADMVPAVRKAFAGFFSFQGKINRGEYLYWTAFWWGVLLFIFPYPIFAEIDLILVGHGMSSDAELALTFTGLFIILTFFPGISMSVRRLRDVGMSGGWWWLCLIPFGAGTVLLLQLLPTRSQQELPVESDAPTMSLTQAIKHAYRTYGRFAGRVPRAGFWWFVVFVPLAWIAWMVMLTTLVDVLEETGVYRDTHLEEMWGWIATVTVVISLLAGLFALGIPVTALFVRRFHDLGLPGWLVLLWFFPVSGWLTILILLTQQGMAGANTYGPDPLVTSISSQPVRADDFWPTIKQVFRRSFSWRGRSDRRTFLYWLFFSAIAINSLPLETEVESFDIFLSSANTALMFYYWLFRLIMFFPNLAIVIRRLHDVGMSGWWLILLFLTQICVLWFIAVYTYGPAAYDLAHDPALFSEVMAVVLRLVTFILAMMALLLVLLQPSYHPQKSKLPAR
ncbi:MAG: DUF805 domain-containing protein [Pseudomonadota bacterium]